MDQRFLLTSAARTLSLASVAREEAERVFIKLRWSDNGGDAYCPHCGCTTVYACRRPNGAPRWRSKACRKDFSVTSGTLFAFHKLPLRSYLLAIAIFCNEVKDKRMLVFRSNQMIHALSARLRQAAMPRRAMVNHMS